MTSPAPTIPKTPSVAESSIHTGSLTPTELPLPVPRNAPLTPEQHSTETVGERRTEENNDVHGVLVELEEGISLPHLHCT